MSGGRWILAVIALLTCACSISSAMARANARLAMMLLSGREAVDLKGMARRGHQLEAHRSSKAELSSHVPMA